MAEPEIAETMQLHKDWSIIALIMTNWHCKGFVGVPVEIHLLCGWSNYTGISTPASVTIMKKNGINVNIICEWQTG